MNSNFFTNIPTYFCGPAKILFKDVEKLYHIPLATFETTLIPSVNRGCKISKLTKKGIICNISEQIMTRSILLKANDRSVLSEVSDFIQNNITLLQDLISKNSQYCKIINAHSEIIGLSIFIRLSYSTGEASGHNMTTKASTEIITFLLNKFTNVEYISVSGNYCVDKKNSAINGILGRGTNCSAEIYIPREICQNYLFTTPEKIVELNWKKNYLGSSIAGSVRSANAHFANILLAFYLATGQDAANIVEGSQGFTYADIVNDELYFSVSCPNIILGSIGNGKDRDDIKYNISQIDQSNKQINSINMSICLISAILCGELSLMASLTNKKELIKAHERYERRNRED